MRKPPIRVHFKYRRRILFVTGAFRQSRPLHEPPFVLCSRITLDYSLDIPRDLALKGRRSLYLVEDKNGTMLSDMMHTCKFNRNY